MDEIHPESKYTPHANLIHFVDDRPGHDRRYAINAEKIGRELGWVPNETFESGIKKTITWYLDNLQWCGIKEGEKFETVRRGVTKSFQTK